MKLFVLHDYFFNGSKGRYFTGRDLTDKEWKRLCDNLLPTACWDTLAVAKAKRCRVCWNDIMDRLAELLIMDGFEKIDDVNEASYNHQYDFDNRIMPPASMALAKMMGPSLDGIVEYHYELSGQELVCRASPLRYT